MLWVTREQIRVNRTATAWLVRRFVDPQAEFVFVAPAEVARIQRERNAIGFDAPGARSSNEGDHETVEKALFLYDALYAALRERTPR